MRRARRKFQNILIFAIDFFSGCGNISVWSRFRFGRLVEGYYHQSLIPFLCRFFGFVKWNGNSAKYFNFYFAIDFFNLRYYTYSQSLAFRTFGRGLLSSSMRLFLCRKKHVNRDCDALSKLLSLDGLTLFWKYDWYICNGVACATGVWLGILLSTTNTFFVPDFWFLKRLLRRNRARADARRVFAHCPCRLRADCSRK